MCGQHVRKLEQPLGGDVTPVLLLRPVAGQDDIQPAGIARPGRPQDGQQGLADRASGGDENEQHALAGSGPGADRNRGARQIGHRHQRRRLAYLQPARQQQSPHRGDPFVQNAELPDKSENDNRERNHQHPQDDV